MLKFIIARNGGDLTKAVTVYQLFEAMKDLPCGKNIELTARLNRVRQAYTVACNYVHSSGKDYMALAQALKEYPGVQQPLLAQTSRQLADTMHQFNGWLFVLERATFNVMYAGNKETILDNLEAAEKRRLV